MYKHLSAYVTELERNGELARISVEVSPHLEMTEIIDRESKRPGGGRALLFENTGTGFPVLANMLGSDKRIAMALGVKNRDEIPQRIETLFQSVTGPKTTFWDKLRTLPLLEEMSRWLPKNRSGRGDCQQVILTGEEIDLKKLPVLTCWPFDGGPFVTLPLVHTQDPDTGQQNVGMYRMQVFSKDTTGMHWHMHKTGERHYRGYAAQSRKMPVSVCLGGDPVYTYAATAPMPDNLDEYLLAGFLRRKPVELVSCITNELRVPADCDIVIEGYVDPAEAKVIEGPFGDHTGFYSLADRYPVFHVTAITHRKNAVYPATIVGIPPQEDLYIAKATEKIFLAPIRFAMLPEVTDLYMPAEGVAHNLAMVSIKTSYPGQGMKVINSMWGAGQMMFNKFIVVAPDTVNIRNLAALAPYVRRLRIPEDLLFSSGPLDVLDHAAPELGFGGKLGINLTGIDPTTETEPITLPAENTPDPTFAALDSSLVQNWGIVWVKTASRENLKPESLAGQCETFLQQQALTGIKIVILLDIETDLRDKSMLTWLALANCDPGRDIEIRNGTLYIDGRTKAGGVNGFAREWPHVVTSSSETIALVNEKWEEYSLGEFVKSPSLTYIGLVAGEGAVKTR